MPVNGSGKYVAPSWHNNQPPYINASELNDISTTLACVPIANGGTGATTAASALTNLGALAKSGVVSKGSQSVPVYFDSSGVAHEITQPLPITLGGTGMTSLDNLRSSMGLGDGTGALAIVNGGTGATTAANALTNLGALAKSNVTSRGSSSTPVYFNSSGVANAISQPIPVSLGGSGMNGSDYFAISDDGGFENSFVRKWGKVVMIYLTTTLINSSNGLASSNGFIPSGYRPANQVFAVAVGTSARNINGDVKNWASVCISTSGDVVLQPNPRVTVSCYYAVNICYIQS